MNDTQALWFIVILLVAVGIVFYLFAGSAGGGSSTSTNAPPSADPLYSGSPRSSAGPALNPVPTTPLPDLRLDEQDVVRIYREMPGDLAQDRLLELLRIYGNLSPQRRDALLHVALEMGTGTRPYQSSRPILLPSSRAELAPREEDALKLYASLPDEWARDRLRRTLRAYQRYNSTQRDDLLETAQTLGRARPYS